MNRIVIDTNIVISFLTNRSLEQQALAAKLFEGASAGKHELLLQQIVITEVVYVLRNLYRRTVEEVAASVRDLIELPGIVVLDKMPWGDLCDLWPREIEEYADAALVAVTRSGRHDYLATFDLKLRKRLKALGVSPYPFTQ
ncbi:MAG: PIN domain-containing protein [Acidobacteriota bacterium]